MNSRREWASTRPAHCTLTGLSAGANVTRCGEVSCCISWPGTKLYSPARRGGPRRSASLTQRVKVLYDTSIPSSASSSRTRTTLPRARAKAAFSRPSVASSHGGVSATLPAGARRMRRTVLRDRASRRLISRRLCPCACKLRTAVRISVGVMRVLPLKRGCQGVDRPLVWHSNGYAAGTLASLARGRDQRRWYRAQRGHTLAQTCDHRLKAAQIAEAFAFGAVAQALAGVARLVCPQGVDEQPGLADHALAGGARCLLIMLEPAPQLPRRQWCPGQRRQQALGMLGAGARQRCDYPVSGPTRQSAAAHRRQRRVGQARQQLQPPA